MKPGDLVRLNFIGLESVFGDDAPHAAQMGHIVPKLMRITDVGTEPLFEDDDGPAYAVEVDDSYINGFLIDTSCFDVVREAANDDNVTPLIVPR